MGMMRRGLPFIDIRRINKTARNRYVGPATMRRRMMPSPQLLPKRPSRSRNHAFAAF